MQIQDRNVQDFKNPRPKMQDVAGNARKVVYLPVVASKLLMG
jgi:hypothetical protein